MPETNSQDASELLNRLVVRIYRGLLQYSVDCWPWTDSEESAEKRAVERMAQAQRREVGRLVDTLTGRGLVVDFGNYPDDSDLHYVSLDYLLGKLIADEEAIVAELLAAQSEASRDTDASRLVADLLKLEKEHASQLRELAKHATPATK